MYLFPPSTLPKHAVPWLSPAAILPVLPGWLAGVQVVATLCERLLETVS